MSEMHTPVKEPSPMKRGLKYVAGSVPPEHPTVKEPSPMKRGLKFGIIAEIIPNPRVGEGTFPDEEGTEMRE